MTRKMMNLPDRVQVSGKLEEAVRLRRETGKSRMTAAEIIDQAERTGILIDDIDAACIWRRVNSITKQKGGNEE